MNTASRFAVISLLAATLTAVANAPAAEKTSSDQSKTPPNARKSVKQLQDDFLKLKCGMFIHFNMETYKGVQWVAGYHSPADFNPGGKVDTDAWADAAVSAGMTYAVLTAKHVSGFCLWDSKYTTYDVMHPDCPYKQELAAQFIKSFKSRGLKVGLYYCWRNPGFGNLGRYKVLPPECDPATHTLKEQIAFQEKQIAELVEKYPDVFYLWNDGLDPQIMPAEEALAFFRGLRPGILASCNWWDWGKKGTPYADIAVKEMRPFPESNTAPGETCWCLEEKWFWQEGARPKTAKQVVELLTTANSRNSNFLLNVGPNKQGKFDAASIKVLSEVGTLRKADAAIRLPDSGEFYAYYTHAAPSGEGYVGKYSDLIVVLGKGCQLEFARATGYHPVWRTPTGAKSVTDLVPGKDQDPHFYYNYVRLVENSPDRIVVHRRYFKDIATLVKANRELDVLNPHGITGVVHELYTIQPDGRVDREIREASGTRFEDWMDARLPSRQRLKLTDAGIEYGPVEPGQKPPFYPRSAVTGSAVKNHADVPRAAHRWTFDEGLKPHEDKVVDAATGTHCAITGLMTHFTRGVSGTALAFDGYYTGVVMETEGRSNEALTVEVWVALDAYPYNTAPLVHQSKGFGKEGWYLGLDAYGHPLVTVAGRTVRAENVVLPLYTWTHVAATLGNGKICLYVDGREAAAGDFAGPVATPPTPILIGRNNEKQRCTDPVRRQRQNLEFVYGIQGLLDEVNVYHAALSPVSVKRAFDALRPSDRASALAKGVLPGDVGPANSFGAAYRTLHFSAVWDRLWRDLPGTEIVVKFDKIPCSVVYWRGTNYAPNWVTDNNRWMADQSSEIGGPHGCSEHMADKQVRHCYSRIIENTPARVVIHWRYPCVDVGYVSGGPGNWTDEYHTIYPDGTGVRQVAWNRGGRRPGFQDIQFLTNPGESALDVMNLQAMTIANLKGESRELTWAPPDQVPKNTLPDGCIEVLNSKSQYKVFAIFQGGRINPWGHGEQSKYIPDPFAGPWNHWPMHLVPSDGRFAVANDRVTHFALGANDASPGNVVMYGFTKAPISTLVPLARMWRNPPPLTDLHGGSASGFDKGQKAFLLESTGARMSFTVAASDESPLVHPCFVIRKFGRGEATVAINGKLAAGVRQGAIVDTDGTPATVIWIERQWASPATFVVEAGADRRPAFKTAAKDGGKPPILVVPAVKESLHVAMDLPPTVDDQAAWQFVEVGKDRPLVAQVVPRIAADGTIAAGGRIVADLSPADAAGGKPRCFRLQRADEHVTWPSAHKFTDDNATSLRLSEGEKPVLVYNYGTITNEKVPKKDSRRSRACYIHPLWGLNGEVLTDDFPRDHYHHHGVFWAWPHVEIGGEKHDLWMYKDITHKTIARLAAQTGPLAAVLGMENGWFVGGRKVMTERVWIEVARPTADWRTVDLDFTWIPVDRPITLHGAEGKSYGGLTVRFAVKNGKQAIITVPGGRAAADLPDTPLPWADLSYPFANADSRSANGTAGLSGAAIFVPRDHPDYPPTWLTRHYGPLCIGWPGVKGKTFGPGKPIRLRYRLWIHKAAADTAALKAAYEAYLAGNSAHWESPNERNDTP